jgi:hypothetical protein
MNGNEQVEHPVEILMDWIRYLFKFEPEKYAPLKDVILKFFKINGLNENNNNCNFDQQNCNFD